MSGKRWIYETNKLKNSKASLLGSLAAAMIYGCGSDTDSTSNTNALSSSDWFKDGVDRFYIAHLESDDLIDERYDATYGDRFFFGVGCYGEPEDPNSDVYVSLKKEWTKEYTFSVK